MSCGQPRAEPIREAGLPVEVSYSSKNLESLSRSIEEAEQRAALSRAGGLRPLGRTYVPMTPKIYPTSSVDSTRRSKASSSQPLFQRAKIALELKEVVKVPGIGDISPSLVLDDETTLPLPRGYGALPSRKSRKANGLKAQKGAILETASSSSIGMSLSTDR